MISLSWITDEDLYAATERLKARAIQAYTEAKVRTQGNIIDPFSSLFLASIRGIDTVEELENIQANASAMSGLSSALGTFHQDILGSIPGWDNHNAGYDLECISKQIVAEVKNKHNTMNASNRKEVIESLDTAVQQKGRGWTGYLVTVIPKARKPFKKRLTIQRAVFEIDGGSFYAKATGSQTAMQDLFQVVMTQMTLPNDIQAYCLQALSKCMLAK